MSARACRGDRSTIESPGRVGRGQLSPGERGQDRARHPALRAAQSTDPSRCLRARSIPRPLVRISASPVRRGYLPCTTTGRCGACSPLARTSLTTSSVSWLNSQVRGHSMNATIPTRLTSDHTARILNGSCHHEGSDAPTVNSPAITSDAASAWPARLRVPSRDSSCRRSRDRHSSAIDLLLIRDVVVVAAKPDPMDVFAQQVPGHSNPARPKQWHLVGIRWTGRHS